MSQGQFAATDYFGLLFLRQVVVGFCVAEQFVTMLLKPKSQALTFIKWKRQYSRLQLFQAHGVMLQLFVHTVQLGVNHRLEKNFQSLIVRGEIRTAHLFVQNSNR